MKNKLESYNQEMEQTFQKGVALINELKKEVPITKGEKQALGALYDSLSEWEIELTQWLEDHKEPSLKKAS